MSIKLNVPFEDKDIVKALGAKWEVEKKTWYIPTEIKNIKPFLRWLSPSTHYLIPVHSYILEGTNKCWKCGNLSKVVTLASATYRTVSSNNQLIYSNDFVIFNRIENVEPNTLTKMHSFCPDYEFRYSKTVKEEYWMNKCEHCKIPIGDFFLFNETTGPFLDPLYSLKQGFLKAHKLNDMFDIPIVANPGTHLGKAKKESFLELIK